METMNDYELLYLMSEQDEEAQKLLIPELSIAGSNLPRRPL